jgi:TRAP-type C4-dicarboxylate transport system permease small subunit
MFPLRLAHVSSVLVIMIKAVAVLALIMMMAHTVANALLRYLAASPITGTNEYVGYWYMPLVAFLGFYLAQRGRAHIEARLVFDRLPLANRIEIQLLGQALTIALCIAFAYYGWTEALDAYGIGQTGGVTAVVIWPVMFIVPLAFALLTLQLVVDAVAVIRRHDPDASARKQSDNDAPVGD